MTSWRTIDFLDDAGRVTVHALQREQLTQLVDRLQPWYAQQDTWPVQWIDAAEHSDMQLRLSAEELRGLGSEIGAVIQRHLEGGVLPPVKRPHGSPYTS